MQTRNVQVFCSEYIKICGFHVWWKRENCRRLALNGTFLVTYASSSLFIHLITHTENEGVKGHRNEFLFLVPSTCYHDTMYGTCYQDTMYGTYSYRGQWTLTCPETAPTNTSMWLLTRGTSGQNTYYLWCYMLWCFHSKEQEGRALVLNVYKDRDKRGVFQGSGWGWLSEERCPGSSLLTPVSVATWLGPHHRLLVT